jgi:uncharacterized membrane protein YphA (DoxX/SURF4 family)
MKSILHYSRSAKFRLIATWICRLLVGATFIISGWSKAIDTWGFMFKIQDYFTAWNVYGMPREIIAFIAGAISCIEFTTGVLIFFGALRRFSVWTATAMMAVLLPLTVYIYAANPVSDCGCFGDFMVISNGATLLKNIVLSCLLIYLLRNNHKVTGVYNPAIQWIVITLCFTFSLILVYVGYNLQPAVDFRPYPVGSQLLKEDTGSAADGFTFVYEKDGETAEFTMDNLPDSTWTFVERVEDAPSVNSESLAIYEDDEDVTGEVIDTVGRQILLVVNDPGIIYLSRARFANELCDYITDRGGSMIALISSAGERFEMWQQLAAPHFEAFSVDETTLKELARGDAAVVYLNKGVIKWKRTLTSLNADMFYDEDDITNVKEQSDVDLLEEIKPIDDGKFHGLLCSLFGLALLAVYLLNLTPKLMHFLTPKSQRVKIDNAQEAENQNSNDAKSEE